VNGAADGLDRHVLAGRGAAQFLHREDGLAVTIGCRGELPLGFSPGTVRRRWGGYGLHLVIPSRRARDRRPRAPGARPRSHEAWFAARLRTPTGRRSASSRSLGAPSVPGTSGTDVQHGGPAWLSAHSREQIARQDVRYSNRWTALPSLRRETVSAEVPDISLYPFPGPTLDVRRAEPSDAPE
jgi:hypothetical protein